MALRNFSWVLPERLAGSGIPGGYDSDLEEYVSSDLRELRERGVDVLVSLQRVPDAFGVLCRTAGLDWLPYPIEDFAAPADVAGFERLVDECISRMNAGKGVCAHCHAGVGRTGLFLACTVGRQLGLDADRAIERVRVNRLALDTEAQEQFVRRFLDGKP